MVVRYQCDEARQGQATSLKPLVDAQTRQMYNGTPTATCGDDGMYVKAGARAQQ